MIKPNPAPAADAATPDPGIGELPTPEGIRERAARILDERGWCRGENTDAKGRRCINYAIHEASWSFVDMYDSRTLAPMFEARDTARRELSESLPAASGDSPPHISIQAWNDNHCPDSEAAVDLLRDGVVAGTDR